MIEISIFAAILFVTAYSAIDHSALDPSPLRSLNFYDKITTETFGGATSYDIGWIKILFCDEAHNDPKARYQYVGVADNTDNSRLKDLAPYAIAAKIVPDESDGLSDDAFDNWAVYTKVCTNPVIALNNGWELSNTINVETLAYVGPVNKDNWYAATDKALNRLGNSCNGGAQEAITGDIYHACGNTGGIHIQANMNQCEFDYGNPNSDRRIEFWLGFDADKKSVCDDRGNGGLVEICEAHSLVIGNKNWETHESGNKREECAVNDATSGTRSNDYGDDIGVQCCKTDGSRGYRTGLPGGDAGGCLTGVDFDTARGACQSKGDRLCTKAEVEKNIGAGSGCLHDARHVWTSDCCTPLAPAPPKEGEAHMIVIGAASWEKHKSGDKQAECATDTDISGEADNAHGDEIGVQCCTQDGKGYRQGLGTQDGVDYNNHNDCLKGVNFDAAKAACEANGDRLCTMKEVEADVGKGSGCDHDARHVWTSTVCRECDSCENMDRLDACEADIDRVDSEIASVNGRVNGEIARVNGEIARVDGEIASVDGRVDVVDGRIDDVVRQINERISLNPAISAGSSMFAQNQIGDDTNLTFILSNSDLLIIGLLILNTFTILFGLCVCWRSGLFGKNKGIKYSKVDFNSNSDIEDLH